MISELNDRRVKGADEADAAIRRMKAKPEPASAVEADALAERIARARALKDPTPHCGSCWERGRDAAIREIEGVS